MPRKIDLTDQIFGKLTVISESPKRNASGQVYWICKCACGKTCEISGTALRTEHTKSCGCYNIEKVIERNKSRLIDLTDMNFGYLTVLERIGNLNNRPRWKCKCKCGKIINVLGEDLRYGHTTSCGCKRTSIGEDAIAELLTQANIPFQQEYIDLRYNFKSSGKHPRFDFFVNNKYYIEYDGKQHFLSENVGWDTVDGLKDTQKRDKEKNVYCKTNNIPLIRIPYTHLAELKIEDLLLDSSSFIVR